MDFKKFSEIEHHDNQKFRDFMREHDLEDGEWSVTEKVHGANFAFYYDGNELKAANRSVFLNPEDKFFNFQKVVEENRDKIISLYNLIKEKMPVEIMIVCGELCGGHYNHPEVRKVKDAIQLQKGISYSPDNIFIAFDIRVNAKYLSVDETEELFEKSGFLYVKELFRGTLEECLAYSNKFQSTIAGILGYPEAEDNVCEGVVIRPVIPKFCPNGQRVILKNKNEKWTEKARERKKKKPQAPVKLSEAGEKLLNEALLYVTENRLDNVISKIGEVTKEDFGKILGMFNKDIIADFEKEFGDDFIQIEKAEQKTIRKKLNAEAALIVRKKFP